jgi:single-strand DNA-binding protein
MDICTATITGRLTRDPELRTTGSGTSVANARLASTTGKDASLFIDLTAWGKTGELLTEYAGKGDPIAVSGRLSQEEWQDKEGQTRSKFVLTVDNLKLPSKAERQSNADEIDF